MAADLGRLVATLEARAERFDLTLERATKRLDGIARETERANERMARSSARLDGALSTIGRGFARIGVAAGAAGVAIGVFAARQVQALDKLGDLSQQTGLTATSLRQLQVGLELNGGTAEQASEGLLTFSRNLGQVEAGTGRLTGLLKKLDPAFLATLRGAGSTSEALRLYADRIAGARTEQEALALATAAFGSAGRQFVLMLRDGAAGVDALSKRLSELGIGNLDKVTEAAQRFDDQMKLLRNVVTTQFTAGLLGVGDGLDRISDALDDETIRDVGALARAFGELGVSVAGFAVGKLEQILHLLGATGDLIDIETRELEAFSRFFTAFKAQGIGDAFDAFNAGVAPVENLRSELEELNAEIEKTRSTLSALERPAPAEGPLSRGARASAIARAREQLEEQEREASRRETELRERAAERPVTGVGHVSIRTTPAIVPRSEIAPGERAPDAALAKARDRFLREQQAFIAAMRQSGEKTLSEAQRLSIKLAETLGKIGQAPGLSAADRTAFQAAAIEEASAAITRAEAEALAKQTDQVQDFLAQYGAATVSEAEQIARQVAEALDKIPGLTQEQRAALEQQARPKIEAGRATDRRTQAGVQQELLQRAAAIEAESLGGLSQATERELAAFEARLAASDLDEKIAKAFSADPAVVVRLQAENQRLLDSQLEDIASSWDETLTEIGAFGEQAFADMVQGWIQGADVSFEGILTSFGALLAKMAAEAAAADIFSALKETGAEDWISGLLGAGGEAAAAPTGQSAAGAVIGGAEAATSAAAIDTALAAGSATLAAAATTAATELTAALTAGSAELATAGTTAAGALTLAAAAISQAAAELTAAAAAAAGGSVLSAVAEGGVATTRGIVRLERVTALASGGYVSPRIERLERVADRIRPTVALARGGYVAPRIDRLERVIERLRPTIALAGGGGVSKLERVYRELSSGRDSATTRELVRSLSAKEREQLIERLDERSSTSSVERSSGVDRLEHIMSERSTDRSASASTRTLFESATDRSATSSLSRVFERSASSSSKLERIYRELSQGRDSETTRELVRSLSDRERETLAGRLEVRTKTSLEGASTERLERILSDRSTTDRMVDRTVERQSDRTSASSSSLSSILDRSAKSSTSSITALVGEAGVERLLTIERVREIAMKAAGDPSRAVQMAKQLSIRLDRPEIRQLVPGDIVIPDSKLSSFFARVTPQAKAAEGGFSPLSSMEPIAQAIDQSMSEDAGVTVNLTISNESGTNLGVKRQQMRRSGRRIDAMVVVGQAGATDVRMGGEMSREMQRSFGVRIEPRPT